MGVKSLYDSELRLLVDVFGQCIGNFPVTTWTLVLSESFHKQAAFFSSQDESLHCWRSVGRNKIRVRGWSYLVSGFISVLCRCGYMNYDLLWYNYFATFYVILFLIKVTSIFQMIIQSYTLFFSFFERVIRDGGSSSILLGEREHLTTQ